MSVGERRTRFRELHARERLFVMPNPWDVGSARLLGSLGFEALVLTGRAENHIRGVDDLEDTIARLIAYRDAGADVVYAPGLTDLGQIARVVEAVGVPVNVLALPAAPSIGELESVGVRRVST